MSDNPKTTLTDGSPVTDDHREIDPATGMQKGYVVLSDEERAKGFVRPLRQTYRHVGKRVCGQRREIEAVEMLPGKIAHVCCKPLEHDGPCTVFQQVSASELARIERYGCLDGCGGTTTMHQALAETYARKPDFYSGTYCAHCRDHFPVGAEGEFVWYGTEEKVGT